MSQRVVVVGAGLAGLRTVEALRQHGHRGALCLVGAEPHRPYDRPPLSKDVLRGERDVVYLRAHDTYDQLGVDLRLGTPATALDTAHRALLLADGSELAYDKLVIATGATPRMLPGSEHHRGVHTLRTIEDAARLHDALTDAAATDAPAVVVGGGFIGCEVAASARHLGVAVTIVEALPQVLVRALGEEVGARVAALHEEHGVRVLRGVGVDGIDAAAEGLVVTLADGSVLPAAAVVVGLGVHPATDWLAGSGLDVATGAASGVVCDAFCAASAPDVFAVGDVARWYNRSTGRHERVEHWTNAAEQAALVAHNVLAAPGEHLAYSPVPYFWSDQYDVKIQALGFPRADDDVDVRTVGPKRRTVVLYSREGRLTGVVGFSAPGIVMRMRALLERGASRDEAAQTLGES